MYESDPNGNQNIHPYTPYENTLVQKQKDRPFIRSNTEGLKDIFGDPIGAYDVNGNIAPKFVGQDLPQKTFVVPIENVGSEVSKLKKAKALFLGKLGLKKMVHTHTLDTLKVNNPFLSDATNLPYSAVSKDNYLGPESSLQDTVETEPIVSRPGEFVKKAAKFSEQVADTSRTNPITYVVNQRAALGTHTESWENRTLTEHDSLVALQDFLKKVADSGSAAGILSERAQSMLENMTFIGKQEYDEATKGIADIWVQLLRKNKNLQICAITGKIAEGMVKSDAYLLDNILKNFSDEQLDEFSGRLVLTPEDLTADPEDVSIIMLDDWTISGSQLKSASASVISDYPKYKDRIEIQLIAATEERIQEGLEVYSKDDQWIYNATSVPVNAYFAANAAPREYAPRSGAHITGAHCAVDFDFNNDVAEMARNLNINMPPATNIVRPYRWKSVQLIQHKRLRGIEHKEPIPRQERINIDTQQDALGFV